MNVQCCLCILFCVSVMPLLKLQHKYGYHIAYITHTAIMLNGHINLRYLPISTKIQPTTTATLHIIAKYVPESSMPLKCHIC